MMPLLIMRHMPDLGMKDFCLGIVLKLNSRRGMPPCQSARRQNQGQDNKHPQPIRASEHSYFPVSMVSRVWAIISERAGGVFAFDAHGADGDRRDPIAVFRRISAR